MSYPNRSGTDTLVTQSDEVVEERPTIATATPTWSPAQIVGLAAGIFFAVLGVAAVARTGFATGHVYTPHATVWSFPHTPLFAVCEIGFGVLLVLASVVPGGARSLMGLLGAIGVGFGLVLLAGDTPTRLRHWLAATHRTGWLYLVVGAVVLLAAIVSPVFVSGTRRRVRHVDPIA
jgi:hypothetical protein